MKETTCPICSLPLGAIELELDKPWHFDCEKCTICGGDITSEIVARCLRTDREISHDPCFDKKYEALAAARPVEVTQGLLDYLNNVRLMIEPEMSRSIEDNQSLAESHLQSWLHEKKIDEIYIALRKMQAVTACLSIVLNEKQKREVSVRISAEEKRKRDLDLKTKVGEAEQYRESEQKQVERKREKQTPEGKAIAALMKTFGWSEDAAREHLSSMKASATRKPDNTVQ